MSWLFSRALVAASSGDTSSAGEPSAPSSTSLMPQAYSSPDRTTAASRLSRYGMTCEPLTESRGEALLTWFRAGFPARTSALQERAPESTASGQDSGATWRGWSAKYDPDTSTWRTAQCSFLEDSDESSVTWPRSGMTQGGMLWERPMSDFRTVENESGSSPVPTPTACDHKGSGRLRLERGANNNLRDYCRINYGFLYPPVKAVEWLMWWPEGWASLRPLETAKFQEWQQQHGRC